MREIRRFYQFLGKYKWRMVLFSLTSALAVAIDSAQPYWLKMILETAGVGEKEVMLKYFGLFGVSIIGSNWISSLSYFIGDKIIIPLSREIRETVFRKVMDLDFAYHVEKNTGSLISAFRRGDSAIFNFFDSVHHELFRVVIGLTVTSIFLFQSSPEMAIILLSFFTFDILLVIWLIKINLKARKDFNDSEDEVAGVIADSMINYETVKFFAAEEKERKRLSTSFDLWQTRFQKFGNSFRVMDVAVGATAGGGMMWIMWLAISKVGSGFSTADLVMVTGFVTRFYWQFFNLFFRLREIAKCMTDMNKYFEILENEVKVKDPEVEVSAKKIKGKIEFSKVGFVYPKNQEKILDDINLVIDEGQKVAFVGRSGAGKTTLVKLLMRFYDPSEGVIKVDGVDIKKIKKTSLRKKLSVVPQEPIMFNNTIKFNLAYGRDTATMEEIEEAARRANILDFIESLPNKWETKVGERGIKLSGGQKQRLAIARCLLADPKILVFDEATSNLDSESEGLIQKALEEVSKKRTVIIIAHRFSTIRNADKIVVLSNGNIVESGKHEELMKAKGLYERLWTLQAKGKLKPSAME